MVVVTAVTGIASYFAQQNLAENVAGDLRRTFQGELDALHRAQEIRYAALAERCRSLVRKPRIHAALEDDALDLLYLSAQDELRDIMVSDRVASPERAPYALHAEFYRFLDKNGKLLGKGKAGTWTGTLAGETFELAGGTDKLKFKKGGSAH